MFKKSQQSFYAYVKDANGNEFWSEKFTLAVCNTQPSFEETSLVFELNQKSTEFRFTMWESELLGCLDSYTFVTEPSQHTITFDGSEYVIVFDSTSLYTDEF